MQSARAAEIVWIVLLAVASGCGDAGRDRDADAAGDGARDAELDRDGALDADGPGDPDAEQDRDADRGGGADSESAWDGALCSMELDGIACGEATRCQWATECVAGSCECEAGRWSCSSRDACAGSCPQPGETPCGGPCDSTATGCMCRCGGGSGPDFTACECRGGSWACARC